LIYLFDRALAFTSHDFVTRGDRKVNAQDHVTVPASAIQRNDHRDSSSNYSLSFSQPRPVTRPQLLQ
jgi:hypothetical protein